MPLTPANPTGHNSDAGPDSLLLSPSPSTLVNTATPPHTIDILPEQPEQVAYRTRSKRKRSIFHPQTDRKFASNLPLIPEISNISEMSPRKSPRAQRKVKAKTADVSKSTECGICYESVKRRGVLDSCDHVFCFRCIMKWSKRSSSCPHCKRPIKSVKKTDGSGKIVDSAHQVRQRRLKDTLDREELQQRRNQLNQLSRHDNSAIDQLSRFDYFQLPSALSFLRGSSSPTDAHLRTERRDDRAPTLNRPSQAFASLHNMPNLQNIGGFGHHHPHNHQMSAEVAQQLLTMQQLLRDNVARMSSSIQGLQANLSNLSFLMPLHRLNNGVLSSVNLQSLPPFRNHHLNVTTNTNTTPSMYSTFHTPDYYQPTTASTNQGVTLNNIGLAASAPAMSSSSSSFRANGGSNGALGQLYSHTGVSRPRPYSQFANLSTVNVNYPVTVDPSREWFDSMVPLALDAARQIATEYQSQVNGQARIG